MRGQTRSFVVIMVLAVVGVGAIGALTGGNIGGIDAPQQGENAPQQQEVDAIQRTCNYERLYDETIGSVVTVQVLTQNGQPGTGSGFVYDGEGHIVTNQHVVANASTVEIQFDRGEWRTAEVVGTDVYSDLAVLKVNGTPDYVTPLKLRARDPEAGQPVAAFGSPLGLPGTITNGIISGTNRSLPAGGQVGPQFPIPNTVQTTAAINPGNSGGPLVNCRGQVVGVNTATLAQSENTGFAVPATRVQRVVPALIQDGSYAHSFLGISSFDVSPIVAEANDLAVNQGVLVRNVVPGSPAAGVLRGGEGTERVRGVRVPVGGDVIVAFDGKPVDSGEDLSSYLTQTRPGDTVTLTIRRNGERMQVEVELARRPPPGEEL